MYMVRISLYLIQPQLRINWAVPHSYLYGDSNMSTPAPRCSCIICHEEKSSKGIHSHYLVSHTSVGKEKLDNARQSAKNCNHPIRKKKNLDKINGYNLNPNKCGLCSKNLSYNKRNNKYCGHSCAASDTNSKRPVIIHKPHTYARRICKVSFCSACSIILPNVRNKFCDKCRALKRSNVARERCKTIPFGGHTSKIKIYFKSKQGFECYLQSSYEITVAGELDANDIKWS